MLVSSVSIRLSPEGERYPLTGVPFPLVTEIVQLGSAARLSPVSEVTLILNIGLAEVPCLKVSLPRMEASRLILPKLRV